MANRAYRRNQQKDQRKRDKERKKFEVMRDALLERAYSLLKGVVENG